jgi:TfoX-like protein
VRVRLAHDDDMPAFGKAPPELIEAFTALADLVPDATRKLTFGYPTCVRNGNMFFGVHGESLFLRLADADAERFVRELGGQPFEPMPGRPMRGYVVVPAGLERDPALCDWVALSFAYAATLPPKRRKKS